MPALSFEKRFAPAVKRGLKRKPKGKRSTIRQRRKHPVKVGDTLYMYTGMRTKQCKKLGEVVCKSVLKFAISLSGFAYLDGKKLKSMEEYKLARKDGFQNIAELIRWFQKRYGLPFKGVLIRW